MKSWEFFSQNIDPRVIDQLRKSNVFRYDLKIIGVSGTVGKTTVAELIAGYLNFIGKRTFYIGTSGLHCKAAGYNQINFPSTSPTSPEMLKTFIHGAYFYHCEYLVIEVTAETISSGVYNNLDFDLYCFTNLRPNIVRSFKNDEVYFNQKLSIFKTNNIECTLTSKENKFLIERLASYSTKLYTFNYNFDIDPDTCKLNIELDNNYINTNLISSINADNVALCYYALSLLRVLDLNNFKLFINTVVIPGRLESFEIAGRHFIIDTGYGGTAGLNPFFEEFNNNKNLIAVMSSYFFNNQNDLSINLKEKRWERARLIYNNSSKMVITATHRRLPSATPDNIEQCVLDQLQKGAPGVEQIYNRAEAIRWACLESEPGDTIMIIGTGSETWCKFKEDTTNNTDLINDRALVELFFKTNFKISTDQLVFNNLGQLRVKTPWLNLKLVFPNSKSYNKISINKYS